jgi:lipoprotein-anchoring transpeptidase ErfK/SrfK
VGWTIGSSDPAGEVSLRLRLACCTLGLALLGAGGASGARTKLSEHSPQIAYNAGLGFRHAAQVETSTSAGKTGARWTSGTRRLGSPSVAYVAFLKRAVVVQRGPWAASRVASRLERRNVDGFREVLGVLGVHTGARCKADWYHVALPVLPNGATGWVPTRAVQTYRVRSRIVVDVSERQLRLYRSGRLSLVTRVAVGALATPTPLGRYFVNERYVLSDARGPFGPNALGISAHSDVLQHVWVEDGPIGIHGTNEPWSLGRAASHGCVRVANVVMRRLFALAPAGTPVIVKS